MAALAQSVRLLGSQMKTGKAIGVSGQAVSEVMRRGRRVPAEWCLKLEKATGDGRRGHSPCVAPRSLSQGD